MINGNALNSYQKAQLYDEIDSRKLVLLLYEVAIKKIMNAKKGIENNDPKQRGENIGKAIAIITELNASLDEDIQTEEINFLRSLYFSMLKELTKISLTNDLTTLDRIQRYLTELKNIWVKSVMNNNDMKKDDLGKNNYQGASFSI